MKKVKNYLSLVKFSHTIFAMPFALIGFFLGMQYSTFSARHLAFIFLLVIICMITARSAAMAFNRYLDRSFDAKNPRTVIREIPRGIISPNSALRFVILSSVIFIAEHFSLTVCVFIYRLLHYLLFCFTVTLNGLPRFAI